MFVVVSYDIENDKARTRLAHKLKDFGPRVQFSVFEADIHENEEEKLIELLSQVKLGSRDSIRLYRLCGSCFNRVTRWGAGEITEDKPYYIA